MEDGQSVVKRHSPAAEEDPERHRASSPVHEKAVVHEEEEEEKAPRRSKRVASLDVFRGLTVAVSWPATSDQTRH
jgi:heparan-alpha-glucosaminide N-acetyltransferase